MNEAEGDIGEGAGWADLHEDAVGLEGFAGLLAELADIQGLRGVFRFFRD